MAIGTTAALIGSLAAPAIGGLIGGAADDGDEDAAREAQRRALEVIQGVRIPTIEEQQILLKELKSAGVLTPQMEAAITQGPSRMEDVKVDPKLKDAQLAALSKYEDRAKGGLQIEDRAALNQILNRGAQAAKGREQAILQRQQAMGMGGSGNELAAQLIAAQGAMQEANQQGLDVGAQANRSALEAIGNMGQLAGQMSEQDFGQQSAKARAADAINQFNTSNRQRVSGSNVDRTNRGQEMNLENKQRIMDTNVGFKNQQEIHNKGLHQQKFQNDMSKAAAMSGQYGNQAAAHRDSAEDTRNMWGGIGKGVGDTFTAFGVKKADGGHIPGEAPHEGDHPDNDIVPAMLSPGEIVIPRSAASSPKEAKKYIDELALKKWKQQNG